MQYENRWARMWPHTVPSVRHVEILALKNAWRAEALDKRLRIQEALTHHACDDDGLCRTCRQPAPCLTKLALTTATPWKRATVDQPLKLPLSLRDVQAALTEMPQDTPDPAPAPAQ